MFSPDAVVTVAQRTQDDGNDVDFGYASSLLGRSDQRSERFELQHIYFFFHSLFRCYENF